MKTVRQQRILELIQMHDIEKQEELVQMLCEDGFDVTQATVSRDISQLRLKKVSGKNGKLVYKAAESKHQQAEPKYLRILKESYVSMDMAMNILVIKTFCLSSDYFYYYIFVCSASIINISINCWLIWLRVI